MNTQIEYINTDKLYPHPQNLRKAIDDVTELADSIKQKGILQNLTVVRGGAGVPDGVDGYTVIIGHRRLTAAKQAGVKEVPCVVAEMTESEQQETMLLENMQRTDLTAVEQAQGFQLLFDMGHSQKEISEKTGFSPATISRRLKIAKLDLEKTTEAEQRGGTLEELVKVSEIKDEKEKEELLDKLGTNNFEWAYQAAIKKQKIAEKEPDILAELDSIAKPMAGKSWDSEHYFVFAINNVDEYVPGMFKEKIEDGKEYQYVKQTGYYSLYEFKKSKTEKPQKKSKAEIKANEHRQKLAELSQRAHKMRKSFIESFTAFKSHESEIANFLAAALVESSMNYSFGKRDIMIVLGVELYDEVYDEFRRQYNDDRLKVQLNLAYSAFSDNDRNNYVGYSYGEKLPPHQDNKSLNMLYERLVDLGYEMSDEEQKLMNGEHELFEEL